MRTLIVSTHSHASSPARPRAVTRPLAVALALWVALVATSPACAPVRPVSAADTTRIVFPEGALSAQVQGRLTLDNDAGVFYRARANAGDRMIVNIISRTKDFATSGEVRAPSGAQDGHHGGIIFAGAVPDSGDYTIRVGRNLMTGERVDGDFTLEVLVLPPYLDREMRARNPMAQ